MEQDNNSVNSRIISEALGGTEVLYYSSVDSTNTEAKRLIKSEKALPFLIVADEQTAGRGRQGKSFYSPKGTGIYMSLVLNLKEDKGIPRITTSASVAVCKAIEALTDKKPKIKWVNDIFLEDKKICGILCETEYKKGFAFPVIIGIGLNVSTKSFPSGLENAGSLSAEVSKNELITEIVSNLFKLCEADFDEFLPYYRSHSMVLGKEITFVKNGISFSAKALETDETGALVVKTNNSDLLRLYSGEISITDYGQKRR